MEPLNALERAILEKMLAGDHPALRALRHQLEIVSGATERNLTGAGFVTTLALPRNVPKAPLESGVIRIGDVSADVDGLEHGAGFLLYIKDGILDALEGYTYGEPWPNTIQSFSIQYTTPGTRDLSCLDR